MRKTLQPATWRVEGVRSVRDLVKVEGLFRIPSRVPPDDYLVRLTAVNHGRLLHFETTHLVIRMSGVPAFLSYFSRSHDALFGRFTVAIWSNVCESMIPPQGVIPRDGIYRLAHPNVADIESIGRAAFCLALVLMAL